MKSICKPCHCTCIARRARTREGQRSTTPVNPALRTRRRCLRHDLGCSIPTESLPATSDKPETATKRGERGAARTRRNPSYSGTPLPGTRTNGEGEQNRRGRETGEASAVMWGREPDRWVPPSTQSIQPSTS